tara:strand:- start:1572 stop:1979 length:408 start_codon:yes stop_codon:yes gene_type:complete
MEDKLIDSDYTNSKFQEYLKNQPIVEERKPHPTDAKYLKQIEPYLLDIFDNIRRTKSYDMKKKKSIKIGKIPQCDYKTLFDGFWYYDDSTHDPDFMLSCILADEYNVDYKYVIDRIEYYKHFERFDCCNDWKYWI